MINTKNISKNGNRLIQLISKTKTFWVALFLVLCYYSNTACAQYQFHESDSIRLVSNLQDKLVNKNYGDDLLDLILQLDMSDSIPISDTAIYNLAVRAGAYYPEIIVAQAIQESSMGRSTLGRKANNIYGMMRISQSGRPTTQIPGRRHGNFGVYHNWQFATIDRVIWEFEIIKHKPKSRHEYAVRMGRIYARGNKNYPYRIEAIAKNWLKNNDEIL